MALQPTALQPTYSYNPFRVAPDNPWDPAQQQFAMQAPAYDPRPLPQQPFETPSDPTHRLAVPNAPAHAHPYQQVQHHPQPMYPPQPMHHAYPQHRYVENPAPPRFLTLPSSDSYVLPYRRPAPPPLPPPQRPRQYLPAQPPRPHTPPALDVHSSVSGHVAAIGPVPRVYPISLSSWTEPDKLALERENWVLFSVKAKNTLGLSPGAWCFVEDTQEDPNTCPSFQMYPAHHRAWVDTDRVVMSFLSEVLTPTERTYIEHCESAKDIWATLRWRHEFRGPSGQIAALKKFVSITYSADPMTWASATTLLSQTNDKIWQCGLPNPEAFLLSGIVNALAMHNESMSEALGAPGMTLAMAKERLAVKQSQKANDRSALAAGFRRDGLRTHTLHEHGQLPEAEHAHLALLHEQGGWDGRQDC
ncbi:hypothetical protein B0H17DRAFT_1134040 [Mycena rosella]|uniref:Uncharacterized protein n=1 Tax=Mycena rosella TaxID=1033263 RepID=A0AAD7DH02_MYCRO|nr:hypothetical protein B0H17DRAFT_1134040 [Mycena rosella]